MTKQKFICLIILSVFSTGTFSYTQVMTEWIQRYNGPTNFSDDELRALTVDNTGNVYVTGVVGSTGGAGTIKYDSAGNLEWISFYKGVTPNDIEVDEPGNVFITGYGQNSNETMNDYVTIKYNPDGIEQWVQRYDGSGNGQDYANSLALDSEGNVFVVGRSWGNSCNEITTIKYSNNGDQLWTNRFETWCTEDFQFVETDNSGNVFVSGIVFRSGSGFDCVTIKYNSSGVEQWVSYYAGPDNVSDVPRALTLDDDGNIYITGRSASSEAWGFLTIKYSSNGLEEWVQTYFTTNNTGNMANAIAVDNSGNVYVTGGIEDDGVGHEYTTIKYNSDGVQQWIMSYDAAFGSDVANAITVDTSGDVYVTGGIRLPGFVQGILTIKYNSEGGMLWQTTYGPNRYNRGIAVLVNNQSGDVYVAGTGSDSTAVITDFITIKYSQTLTNLEENSFDQNYSYFIQQNYPNPFNPSTTIKFSLPKVSMVTLKVYNIVGEEVATLLNEEKDGGIHSVNFDAGKLSSGVYFYKIRAVPLGNQAGSFTSTKKMLLLK